ncbi:MAG: SAM-dependent methyltransferase [Saprospiraceae bacterium]|nr:SAM-dependent methyltransferase [Saprospiraceae bacterium]
MKKDAGTLFLLPNTLGSKDLTSIPPAASKAAARCTVFVVESLKMGRRLLSALLPDLDLDQIEFYELNKRTDIYQLEEMTTPLLSGKDVGLVSDAGLPAVADPGGKLVALAHQKGIPVKPISGPNSLMLALMASGFNGQQFTFHGYLPQKADARRTQILAMERKSSHATQIFMETPYRNQILLDALMTTLRSDTLLCVACDLTLPSENILTQSIRSWKNNPMPALDKRPCVYLLGRTQQ